MFHCNGEEYHQQAKDIDVVVLLFMTFFVFNVHYPHGCTNVYTALEAILLDKTVGRRPTVTAYLERVSKP